MIWITSHLAKKWTTPCRSTALRWGVCLGLLLAPLGAGAIDLDNGRRIYQNHCESCHGPTGVPDMLDTPNFTRGEGLMQPDAALIDAVRRGKNSMPAFDGVLNDVEIVDVITYVRSFF